MWRNGLIVTVPDLLVLCRAAEPVACEEHYEEFLEVRPDHDGNVWYIELGLIDETTFFFELSIGRYVAPADSTTVAPAG